MKRQATVLFAYRPQDIEGTAFAVLWEDDDGNPVTEAEVTLDDGHDLGNLPPLCAGLVQALHGVSPLRVEAVTVQFGEG